MTNKLATNAVTIVKVIAEDNTGPLMTGSREKFLLISRMSSINKNTIITQRKH